MLKAEYDFSKGKWGAVLPPTSNKTRITIRIDSDTIDWVKTQVEKIGAGNYQTLIHSALRHFVDEQQEPREKILRKVHREERRAAKVIRSTRACA